MENIPSFLGVTKTLTIHGQYFYMVIYLRLHNTWLELALKYNQEKTSPAQFTEQNKTARTHIGYTVKIQSALSSKGTIQKAKSIAQKTATHAPKHPSVAHTHR